MSFVRAALRSGLKRGVVGASRLPTPASYCLVNRLTQHQDGLTTWMAQSPTIRKFHVSCLSLAAPSSAPAFLDRKEVTERIINVVKNFEKDHTRKVDPTKVTPDARFKEELALDSLDAVEVVMAIEDEFALEIPDAESDKIMSINDAIEYVVNHPMAK